MSNILQALERAEQRLADYIERHPSARVPASLEREINELYERLEKERHQAERKR